MFGSDGPNVARTGWKRASAKIREEGGNLLETGTCVLYIAHNVFEMDSRYTAQTSQTLSSMSIKGPNCLQRDEKTFLTIHNEWVFQKTANQICSNHTAMASFGAVFF